MGNGGEEGEGRMSLIPRRRAYNTTVRLQDANREWILPSSVHSEKI
jgi:hypothetical protein